MSFVSTVDNLISRFGRKNIYSRCDAVANISEHQFTTHEGGFISSFDFSGAMRFIAKGDIDAFAKKIDQTLSDSIRQGGHTLSFYVDFNPALSNNYVNNIFKRDKRVLDTVQLESPIPLARKKLLNKLLRPFSITLTITTDTQAINAKVRDSKIDDHFKSISELPNFSPSQNAHTGIKELYNKHMAFCSTVSERLKKLCVMSNLPCEEVMFRAHDGLYRVSDTTEKRMQFQLLPKQFKIHSSQKTDIDGLSAPSIAQQIVREDLEPLNNDKSLVPIGKRVFAPMYILHNPFGRNPLSELFEELGDIPYRMAIHIKTGEDAVKAAVNNIGTKARNTRIFGGDNNEIYKAAEFFKKKIKQGATATKISFSFTTWGSSKAEALKHREALAASVSSWGGSTVHYEKGDAVDAVLSTIPLFGTASKSPPLHPWLFRDAIKMIPFSVSAALFKNPDLTCVLPSGQPYPLEFGAQELKSFSMLVTAPSGSGKSSFISNVCNSLTFRSAPGEQLPPIGIIDNSKTQTYWKQAIESGLPPSLRYQIKCITPDNREEDAINVLDLPLGLKLPPGAYKSFLDSYLVMLITPATSNKVPMGLDNFCSFLISEAYRQYAGHKAKLYNPGDEVIDTAIQRCGIETHSRTTFHEITEELFKRNEIEGAYASHTWAMPTMYDLVTVAAQSDALRQKYDGYNVGDGNTTSLIDFVCGELSNICDNYPALAHRTQINLVSARIKILNLQSVAPKASEDPVIRKQSSLFYGMAWQALFGEYFLRPEDIKDDAVCPPTFRVFQEKRLQELSSTLKAAIVDEFHRCSPLQSVVTNAMSILKEGRARQIFGMFVSQDLTPDFPDDMIINAPQIVMLGMPEKDSAIADYRKHLSFTEAQEDDLVKHLSSPFHPKWGSSCALYIEHKQGSAFQLAYIPAPAEEVHQITTTGEERELYDAVSRNIPYHKACIPLAEKFGFSLKDAVIRVSKQYNLSIPDAAKKIAENSEFYEEYNCLNY